MRSLVRIGLITAGLGLLLCIGQGVPFDVAFALAFGWIFYLLRVGPEVRIHGDGVATALACLVLLTVGSHFFLRWLYEQASEAKAATDRRWRWRWTAWLVSGIVLMFVAGLTAAGVVHQVGWLVNAQEPLVDGSGSGPAVVRAQSTNNLKQIGLGLYNYQQASATFPPGGTFDGVGRALHGWQAMILPYTDHKDLHDQIDFLQPWDDARNRPPMSTPVSEYLHPAIEERKDRAGHALSHYAANARVLGGDGSRSPGDVTDGTAVTLMAGEVVEGFKPWGDPTNWRDPALGINRSAEGFGSPSKGGANFLMVDGSVHFIKESIDPHVLKALSTPRGGEPVSSQQY